MTSSYPEGSRRAKIAGYLQAANKLRQDYQAKRVGAEEYPDVPGSHQGIKVSRHGDNELILFPSYATDHVKRSHHHNDLGQWDGAGDAEYWKREWEVYEDANAIVDVDLRGWIYTNLKGPMNRRNRLVLTVARQLSGIQAPEAANGYGGSSMADLQSHTARHESEVARREAQRIERRGQQETEAAQQGAYSMRPEDAYDGTRESDSSGTSTPLNMSVHNEASKREAWIDPSEFSPEELERANKHLTTRLRPFLTNPSMNTALTIFYYNRETSQSRTTTTNEYGHFNFRAALNFVPTHVRVLAGENLSATEEVLITESSGISLISDIDDTVKHSAISAGAREIFRNTFIRELADLTIDGVRQWYGKLHDLGVKLHYVSNSPWQLYPVLAEYFAVAGLPPGSFHLKQYTGMLQGIFEPAAERKKGSLDRILHDFPNRRFILVGDSGEADLEVYTDVALANPKRILAILIRDVTTPKKQSLTFFNSSKHPSNQYASPNPSISSGKPNFSSTERKNKPKPPLPPRRNPSEAIINEDEDLIDLGDDYNPSPLGRSVTEPTRPGPGSVSIPLRPAQSSVDTKKISRKPPPPPPPKPRQFSTRSELTSQANTYTEAVRDKLVSIYNAIPASPISSAAASRSSSPASSTRFGQGSLAFVGDGNKTNDKPAPPLPPRRVTGNLGGGARQYSDISASNKKEDVWKRRWLRAKEMLDEKGIMLKAWRTGSDVMEETIKLVKETKGNY